MSAPPRTAAPRTAAPLLLLAALACGPTAAPPPTPEADDTEQAAPAPVPTEAPETPEAPPPPAKTDPQNAASVISWNLEQFPLTPETLARATNVLTDLHPDVVAVQEVSDPTAFYDLVASLPGYAGVLNDDSGAWLRVGLIYDTSRVTLTDVETLFPDDWYAFPRPPLKARVTIHAPEPIDFIAMVLHLKAQLDWESFDRRRTACQTLDAWVQQEIESGPERDVMLLGDFNDKLLDPPQWNAFGPLLQDAERYRFLTLDAEQAGEHTYIPYEAMIDHVVVTHDMLDEVGTGETEVLALDQAMAGYEGISDHRPVRTWLRW